MLDLLDLPDLPDLLDLDFLRDLSRERLRDLSRDLSRYLSRDRSRDRSRNLSVGDDDSESDPGRFLAAVLDGEDLAVVFDFSTGFGLAGLSCEGGGGGAGSKSDGMMPDCCSIPSPGPNATPAWLETGPGPGPERERVS